MSTFQNRQQREDQVQLVRRSQIDHLIGHKEVWHNYRGNISLLCKWNLLRTQQEVWDFFQWETSLFFVLIPGLFLWTETLSLHHFTVITMVHYSPSFTGRWEAYPSWSSIHSLVAYPEASETVSKMQHHIHQERSIHPYPKLKYPLSWLCFSCCRFYSEEKPSKKGRAVSAKYNMVDITMMPGWKCASMWPQLIPPISREYGYCSLYLFMQDIA